MYIERTAKTLIRLADAQADLSLRWAHSHFVGFVMSRLIYVKQVKDVLKWRKKSFFTSRHGFQNKSTFPDRNIERDRR